MGNRACSDWLKTYLAYTASTEPPKSYHVWTGISTIAAALQRKVYMDWGHFKIYPNMYVVLVGPPGGRKGTAMKMGKELLNKYAKIDLAPEYITRAALIQAIEGAAVTTFMPNKDKKGKEVFLNHCSLTIFSEELAVFLGDKSPDMVMTLTDLFDCPSLWKYQTKNSGSNTITNAWLNLLGAITPTLLQSVLNSDAVGGGLTSRMVFVVEQGKAKKVALPFLTQNQIMLQDRLGKDLQHIAQMAGKFLMDEEAICTYANWYDHSKPIHPDVTALEGYNERKALHLLKLSMILSACRSDKMVITAEDINQALDYLAYVERSMARAYHGYGHGANAQALSSLMTYLTLAHRATRRQLLVKFKFDMDPQTLDAMLQTLVEMNMVKITHDRGATYYVWTGDTQ